MKRRNFVVASVFAFGAIKAMASKTKDKIGNIGKTDISQILSNQTDVIFLKRGSVVQLPNDPTPVESILQFDISNYRFGKAPVILLNGHRIDGVIKEKVNVAKDLHLKKTIKFYLQYTGPDVGWIVLS